MKDIPIINTDLIHPAGHAKDSQRRSSRGRRQPPDHFAKEVLRFWQGDLHTHSRQSTREGFGYTESIYDLEEILAYYGKLGLAFVAITDHSSQPASPQVQAPTSPICQSLLETAQRITHRNQHGQGGIVALAGVEANLLFDSANHPRLDLPDEVLEKLDLVIASRHGIAREKEPPAIKESLLFAVRHPLVDVIGHLDRYSRRDGEQLHDYWQTYWGIWPDILEEAARKNKAIEINLNSQPSQQIIALAVTCGCQFALNFDAHEFSQYKWHQSPLVQAGEVARTKWGQNRATDQDMELLTTYKTTRLTQGPGVIAPLRLKRWIAYLQAQGVPADRIINSSVEKLLHFLTTERGKTTDNLTYLRNTLSSETSSL